MLPSTRSSIEPPRPRVQHQSRIPTGIKSSIIVFLLSFFIFRYITSPLYTLSNHRNIPLGFIYKIFLRQNWSKKEKKPHGEKRGYYFIRRLLHAHSAMAVDRTAVYLLNSWQEVEHQRQREENAAGIPAWFWTISGYWLFVLRPPSSFMYILLSLLQHSLRGVGYILFLFFYSRREEM